MTKFFIVAMVLFLFCGCDCENHFTPRDVDEDRVVEAIHYIKDPKTNLCFAYVVSKTHVDRSVVSITNVPCVQENF
jgi:hypothetical protein